MKKSIDIPFKTQMVSKSDMICQDITCEVAYTSFARNGKGLFRNQVEVDYSPTYNRNFDSDLECMIASRWIKASQKNPDLHNRTKFRLKKFDFSGTHATVKLGTTCCCDYIGTNCMPLEQAQCWEKYGVKCYQDPCAFMANPLYIGVLVHTNEDQYLFLRRTRLCCEKKGFVDRAVNIPDPQSVPNSCSLSDSLFNAALEAVEDEIGIPRSCCCDPELLGLLQNRNHCFSPSLEFYVRCTGVAQKDIYFQYLRKKNELWKNPTSSDLIFTTWAEMTDSNSLLNKSFEGTAKGILMLYNELKRK